PSERRAFALAEDISRLMPHRDQDELVHGQAMLEQIAGMHIDAEGAAIYLRNPQIHKMDQFFWQAAILQDGVYPAKSLVSFRRSLGVVHANAHDESFDLLGDKLHRLASWPI